MIKTQNNLILQIIIITLLIFIIFDRCGNNNKLNQIQNNQIKNQVLIEELDRENIKLLDTIDYYIGFIHETMKSQKMLPNIRLVEDDTLQEL